MMKETIKALCPSGTGAPLDAALREDAANTRRKLVSLMEELDLSTALATIWRFIGSVNKYIDEAAPWALARDESKGDELARVMYNLA